MTSFMERYETDPQVYVRQCIDELTKLGAVRLEATYSGGNDEGGVDEIQIFNAADEALAFEGNWEHPLQEAANDLLSTEFYTWAGEFYAYGTLHVDVVTGKARREGTYETPQGREDSQEY
jgi:hypothetical protein